MRIRTSRLAMTVLLAVLCTPAAWAQTTPAKTLTPQQQRMADCNKAAAGQSGEARKAYMSSCLKGEAPAPVNAAQQRMKDCNAQAASQALSGERRKTFMSACLKSPKH